MSKSIAVIGQGFVGRAFKELVQSHYRVVTYDPVENEKYPKSLIDGCDLSVVCVPTPEKTDQACDTSIVEQAVSRLETPLVLIKSTVAPGTTDRLRKSTGKRICFSPEYICETTYYNPYWQRMIQVPFVVVGGIAEDAADVVSILEPVLGPTKKYHVCSALEAEVIKYMENCFFAAKVTFVNEFFNICRTFGVDWHRVREGFLLDGRINPMHTSVFKDSPGFGGRCLPKDLNAIIRACEDAGYVPDFLKEIRRSNERLKDSGSG